MKRDVRSSLRRARLSVALCTVGGFLASILPLATLLVLRWERYTALPAGGVRLTAGGILVAILLLLSLLGKLRIPSRLTLTAIALALVYLLEGILPELSLILWVLLGGTAVETLVFSPLLRRARARRDRLAQSDATAGAVEELLKKYVGGNKDE